MRYFSFCPGVPTFVLTTSCALILACTSADIAQQNVVPGAGGASAITDAGAGAGGGNLDAEILATGGVGAVPGTGGVAGIDVQDAGDDTNLPLVDAPVGAGGEQGMDAAPNPDAGPTPVMPSAGGQLVITEVKFDAVVVEDALGEWFELYNPSATASYDLFNCRITDHSDSNSHTISKHVIVGPGEFKTFAIFVQGGGFTPDYTYTVVRLDNDLSDGVRIVCDQTLIDSFIYPMPAPSWEGHALSVDPAHYDADNNDTAGNYCLATQPYNTGGGKTDYGTPGKTNPPCF